MEFNAFGKSSSKIRKIINDIVACEVQQSSDLSNTEAILLSIGGSVIGICLIAFIPILCFVENRLNMLWKQIKLICEEDVCNFRQVCQDRLEQVHNSADQLDQSDKSIAKVSSKFNYVKRYMIKIIIFLFIGSMYLIISKYLFYQKFQEYLQNRPKVSSDLIYSRIYVSEVDYWTKEVLATQVALDLNSFNPEYIPSGTDYDSSLDASTSHLLEMISDLTNPIYRELIGSQIYSALFQMESNPNPMLSYGIYSGSLALIADAYNVAGKKVADPDITPVYLYFYNCTCEIGQAIQDTFQNFISYSTNVIESFLSDYIIFSVFLCVVFMIYYLYLYIFVLSEEQLKIISLNEVSKIIISINSYKKK